MKDFWKSWKFWAAAAAVILLIVAVVLWFVNRPFCYATSAFTIGSLVGYLVGYFAKQQ